MREILIGLVEKADLAIAVCAGVVSESELAPVARSAANARIRLSYPEDMAVVALAGGTGSGKSSLLNAICGAEIAHVGGVRPTTSQPLAVVPAGREGLIEGLLEELGLGVGETHDVGDWLCLIDMPDTDSVEVDHRLRVSEMLPWIDVVVWVVDPEKYRDAALHDSYLKPLSPYERQFVFVLNRSDRLDPAEVSAVVADLTQALKSDGIREPTVIVTSANPPAGPPVGVSDLLDALGQVTLQREGVLDKLSVDLEQAARRLLTETGGAGLDFDRRALEAVRQAATQIVDGDTNRATAGLTGFSETLASETGDPVAARIRQKAAATPSYVQRAAEDTREPAPSRRLWVRGRRSAEDTGRAARIDEAMEVLDEIVITPLRAILAERARANAALTDLAISVASARDEAYR